MRNLIAGRGGGGGGGDAGAGRAPGASPPPVPAGTGAAQVPATATLAAGRSAAQAPASALDTADALTGARQAPLEELVHPVGARASEEIGVAGIVMRAEDLPELTRSNDTAEQLRKLRETLRIDAPMAASEAASEAAGGFRTSELDGAGSMHRANGALGALEIEPPSTVYGENARRVCPHPGNPRGERPEIKLGLPGGADRPPQPAAAAPESDFCTTYRRLRDLKSYYRQRSRMDLVYNVNAAIVRVHKQVVARYTRFGGNMMVLEALPGITVAEHAYLILQETARQADRDLDLRRADDIRKALQAIDSHAVESLEALTRIDSITETPPSRATRRRLPTIRSTLTVTAIPLPGRATLKVDWITTRRQLLDLDRRFSAIPDDTAHFEFRDAAFRMSRSVIYQYRKFAENPDHLLPPLTDVTRAEQAYRAIGDLSRQARESGDFMRIREIDGALRIIDRSSARLLGKLTVKYGALDALSTQPMLVPPVTRTPPVAVPSTTVPPVERWDFSVPAHPIARALNPAFPEPAGGLVHTTGVPGPPPASGLPEPSLAAASGAAAGGLWRGWLDPPATVSGATAAQPVAIETIVTPSLGGTSSFWLQPADPWPAPPPSTPGRTGAGAGAPPTGADPWRIRPPGTSGEPHPVAFGPWSAPPGPSGRVVYTEAIRTPVLSAGAPPGWQGAGTPGFARATSGAFELPFSRREAIARRFSTDGALFDAEITVQLRGADALGWSATQGRTVLDDLRRLTAIARVELAGAAAMADVDWSAIETLGRILDDPPPSP